MGDLRYEVLILGAYNLLPRELPEFLQQKGFASQFVADIGELSEAIQTFSNPILVVDCGPSRSSTQEQIDKVLEISNIHLLPVIFAGPDAEAFQGSIEREFKFGFTLQTPCINADVLDVVRYAIDVYVSQKRRKDKETSPEPLTLKALAQSEELKQMPAPERFFKSLQASGLENLNFKVEEYIRGQVDYKFLVENNYLPKDTSANAALLSLLDDSGKWARLHLCRLCYLTNQLLETIELNERLMDAAKAASFLYSLALVEHHSELMRINYLNRENSNKRKELSTRIKDSAIEIGSQFKFPELSAIVGNIARLIAEEEEPNESEVSLIASMIVAADLLDRLAFQTGRWTPRNANALLRRAKEGRIGFVHALFQVCLVKFVSEAVSASPPQLIIPFKLRKRTDLIEEAKRSREAPVKESEKKVEIADLMPGMRLSKPLVAFDGKEILTTDLTLDQDLIWRLWQLSSVRALNAPLVVSKN